MNVAETTHDDAVKPIGDFRTASLPSSIQDEEKSNYTSTTWQKTINFISWAPPWVRWNSAKPPRFSMWLNLLFAFASAFTVANLYYSHPILNILAHDFDVSQEEVARIPTLAQAGYAVGLFFLCPLGDILQRRALCLVVIFLSATLWIGLCITTSFNAFCGLSFITGFATVTPQLMAPLVADLAPPQKRAMALSIVVSGTFVGILLARILSGIVAQYTNWRNIYWIALGLQYGILALLWLFMPDYPTSNPGKQNYFKILWSVVMMLKKHPVLVQASLISFTTSACFTSYWTTLTFLLAGSPYHYDSLVIGLFALIGLAGMALSPVYARTFIDRFVPHFSVLVGIFSDLIGVIIGTYIGTFSVAGPIIQAFALDAGMQITNIANRNAIFAVEPHGRARVNTAFTVISFLGQLTGTAAGNKLYATSGWEASGSLSVGLLVFALLVVGMRGPWEQGWLGWHGGYSMTKKNKKTADGMTVEAPNALTRQDTRDRPRQMTSSEKALEEYAGEDDMQPNVEMQTSDEPHSEKVS